MFTGFPGSLASYLLINEETLFNKIQPSFLKFLLGIHIWWNSTELSLRCTETGCRLMYPCVCWQTLNVHLRHNRTDTSQHWQ